MIRLLIIADDFTGALDTGVQFAKRGIGTQVFVGRELIAEQISCPADVVVVDSETRPLEGQEAYEVVAGIVRQALTLGVEVIYKKTDSALRGNVGSELSAALWAAGGGQLYFIPAYPDVRRTTLGGIHYIDGVRLEDSGFGKDPFDPMTCSSVADILAKQSRHPIRLVGLGEAPGSVAGSLLYTPEALGAEAAASRDISEQSRIEAAASRDFPERSQAKADVSRNSLEQPQAKADVSRNSLEQPQVGIDAARNSLGQSQAEAAAPESIPELVVFDAVTNEDIRTRVEWFRTRLSDAGGPLLLAGCAGLAAFLPDMLKMAGTSHGSLRKTAGFYVGCGSVNPITLRQVEYAESQGFVRRTLLPCQKLTPDYFAQDEGKQLLEEIAQDCRRCGRVIVDSFDLPGGETTVAYANGHGICLEELRFAISACHGKIARYLIEHGPQLTFLLTGGDTLMGLMREIGESRLHILDEVGQGTVLSQLVWGERTIQVISKSGGFGEPEVLVNIARQIVGSTAAADAGESEIFPH